MSWGDLIVSGAIINTVTDYEIQPQRTKHFTKRNTLDELSETWIGPASQEDAFVPSNGTPHPIYPMMTLLTVEVRRYVQNCGVVSQVTLNYHGKMKTGGSNTYVSAPTFDTFWSEGEVGWEEAGSQTRTQTNITQGYLGAGGQVVPVQTQLSEYQVTGVQQWSRRYIGRNVRVGYITNKRPSGNPGVPGYTIDLRPYTGFALVYDIRGPFQQGATPSGGSQSVVSQILCTDVNVSDSADGWYQVTETYQSRMYVVG